MEAMLEPQLKGGHLVLMGTGELAQDLRAAATDVRWGGRIHVLQSVPPGELLSWVASADVGAMPLQPATLNLRLSTPNKLFECLAAGTPVVVSDFPAMRGIVLDDPAGALGTVCDPSRSASIALAIDAILALGDSDRAALRVRCREAAAERWNWEHEARTLLKVYQRLNHG
jgi:glycosyltransferase involved in cell wall biosynthesis